ncbi:LacI family transcriptional regulator [Spirochaetia bacterium]|nr:LacI family transcriptional regulator [Spirochaetia bacterium]
MAPRIKMSDIAKELGVSTVTVSKALADKEGVGAELRKRIKQKAEEMDYVYNSLPRNMLEGRNYNIGILIGAKYLGESSFYWTFYQHLLDVLKPTRYAGILEIVSNADETDCVVPTFISTNKADGIILLGQLNDAYLAMITNKTPRCIFLDFYSDIGKRDCIASNNFLGSYNITKLLIAAGHTKIAFIGSTSATTSILDRYMGFCKAMLESNLSYTNAIPDRDGNGNLYEEIALDEGATSYVCNNDRLAGRIIRQLARRGIQVPRDVSIAGFDNEGSAVTGGIGVTSLEVNITAMCETAVQSLIQYIETPEYQGRGRIFIDGSIAVKQSIAPPSTTL